MNNLKATPGPWAIGAIESGRVAIDGPNGEEITGYIDLDDAHLILAAHDLYEALEMMWDTACTNASCLPSKQAFIKAHAALAKARGEIND